MLGTRSSGVTTKRRKNRKQIELHFNPSAVPSHRRKWYTIRQLPSQLSRLVKLEGIGNTWVETGLGKVGLGFSLSFRPVLS